MLEEALSRRRTVYRTFQPLHAMLDLPIRSIGLW